MLRTNLCDRGQENYDSKDHFRHTLSRGHTKEPLVIEFSFQNSNIFLRWFVTSDEQET